jgi:hypothetical protein
LYYLPQQHVLEMARGMSFSSVKNVVSSGGDLVVVFFGM